MAYVTSVERLAKEEAQVEMLIRALERQYRVTVPEEVAARIREMAEPVILERWLDLAYSAVTFEEFQQQMQSVQEKQMPYVTSIERLARCEEQQKMLILLLEQCFDSPLSSELRTRIKDSTVPEQLEQWFRQAINAVSLEEFQQRMQP